MAAFGARRDDPAAVPLPAWAKEFQQRLRQKSVNTFILTGPGVRDLHPRDARLHGSIREYLQHVVFATRAAIIFYDRGAGIRFADTGAQDDFQNALKAYDRIRGTTFAQSHPRDPDRALQLVESFLRNQLEERRQYSAVVVIDYAETVAPAGEPGQLPVEDRGAIVTLRRWASDAFFLARDVTFVLLAESASQLNPAIVGDARTLEIRVRCLTRTSASASSPAGATRPTPSRRSSRAPPRCSPRASPACISRPCAPRRRRTARRSIRTR